MVLSSNKVAIENLEAAYNGSTVRQALIDLIETFSQVGGDVKNLGGHSSGYYVLVSELDAVISEINNWLQYDTEPINGSLKVLKNKDFTAYFKNGILEKLKEINGDIKGDYSKAPEDEIGNNIGECLTYLKGTIKRIEDAIEDKGVTIQDSDSVMDLAERITEIQLAAIDVKPITITENGKQIESDIIRDHGVPISGTAYNPVTVKIAQKGYEATGSAALTSNGNHNPPEGFDGFSKVEVRVNTTGSGGSGSGSGENGELRLQTKDIDQNGEYAPDNGYDGFSEVNVHVTDYEPPEEKTCTVTFRAEDADKNVTTQNVEVTAGQRATFMGDVPRYDDTDFWYFKGWEPVPKKVVTDMTVNAKYELWTPGTNFMGESYSWCPYSWKDILTNGAGIGDGQTKLLRLKDNNIVVMMYVGSGRFVCLNIRGVPTSVHVGNDSWENEPLREYLNGDFFQNYIPDWLVPFVRIESKQQAKPTGCLTIDEFEKTFLSNITRAPGDLYPDSLTDGMVGYGIQYGFSPADKVWIPSADELNLIGDSLNQKGDFYEGKYLSNSVAYDSVYYTRREVWPGSDPPVEMDRYIRSGYKYDNMYKRVGRKATVIPTKYQMGLIKKNCGYSKVEPPFPSEALKTYSLDYLQNQYEKGNTDSADSLISKSWLHTSWSDTSVEPPRRYSPLDRYEEVFNRHSKLPLLYGTGTRGYPMTQYIDSNSIANPGNILLRDVVMTQCYLNDVRTNDQYDSETFYTSPPKPIADYGGGTDRCTGVYQRATMSPYGYLDTAGNGNLMWGITLNI